LVRTIHKLVFRIINRKNFVEATASLMLFLFTAIPIILMLTIVNGAVETVFLFTLEILKNAIIISSFTNRSIKDVVEVDFNFHQKRQHALIGTSVCPFYRHYRRFNVTIKLQCCVVCNLKTRLPQIQQLECDDSHDHQITFLK